jgi:hypothetical protein
MTWVIGASSIFDYGAMISDVRVTPNFCECRCVRARIALPNSFGRRVE